MTQFTQYVGVAPGTTTINDRSNPGGELSCMGCSLGNPAHLVAFNPYANEARLTGGLRGTAIRWDLFALTLGLGFASVLAYSLSKRSLHKDLTYSERNRLTTALTKRR